MPAYKSYSFKLVNRTRTYSQGKYHTIITMKDWDDDVSISFTVDTNYEVIDVGNLSLKCKLPEDAA